MATTPAGKVHEVMHKGCECIGENQTLMDAAKRMEELDIGAMPICGEDDRLKGMLTDRDIVVKGVAQGKDLARTRCGEFAQGRTAWIRADASLEMGSPVEFEITLPPEVTGGKENVVIQCRGRVVRTDESSTDPDGTRGVACVIDSYEFVRNS